MRRLAKAGFKNALVRTAILPEWWDETCDQDPSLLMDLEIRVARFFSLPLQQVKDPMASISLPSFPGAQLRRIRDLDRDRLFPAIHAAVQVAAATVRNLRRPDLPVNQPPVAGLEWRHQLSPNGQTIKLEHLLTDLWARGIPVVPVEQLPVPNFQGLACLIGNRPVVMLGQKFDEPGRVAFLVAHEAGHIANGDCTAEQIIVDAEDEIPDDAVIEQRADHYGLEVLAGSNSPPTLGNADFKAIAREAIKMERDHGIDAGVLISAWARTSGDYKTATMANKALYRISGARNLLREQFDRHVEFEGASESDRALLRCVFSGPASDEAAD
jgi:hypothetical protein